MKKTFTIQAFFTALFLLIGTALWAQDATIKGIIRDGDENDAEIFGAGISVANDAGVVIAMTATGEGDTDGAYSLSFPAGTYKLVFSYTGKRDDVRTLTIAAGETQTIDVSLTESVGLDEMVITGGRYEKELAREVTSMDVLKPALLENINATKADEVINKTPGVSVVDGQANIRGGSGYSYGAGSRVLLLIDDMPFLAADAGFPNWRDVPIENLDQIEVLKGAGSALYGSSALNGIINIRTGYAKSKPESKISVFYTGFGMPKRENTAWWKYDSLATYDYDATAGTGSVISPQTLKGRAGYRTPMDAGLQFAHRRKFGKYWDFVIGGNLFYFDSFRAGEYERKFRVNGSLRRNLKGGGGRNHIGVNYNLNLGKGGSFFLWGNNGFSPIIDSAIYIPLSGTITETTISRWTVDPFATFYDTTGGRHRIQTRLYSVSNQNKNNQSNQSVLLYGEYQYSKRFKKLKDLNLVAGAVGQGSFINAELYGNAKYRTSNFAGYMQLEKGFLYDKTEEKYRLNVSFGTRVEYNSIISPDSVIVSAARGRELNPEPVSRQAKPVFRFGVNYELVPKITFLRASWGQGYRYPTIAERYISTIVGTPGTISALEVRANPRLQAETGWSAEIGIKQGLASGADLGGWKGFLDVSVFMTEYQNMMEFTFKGGDTTDRSLFPLYFSSKNIGNTRIFGFEGSLMGTGKIGKIKTNILTGYTYLDPRFKDFNRVQQIFSSDSTNILKYRNRHTVKFDVDSFFLKNNALSVGVSFNYTSRMQAIDRAFEDLNVFDGPGPTNFDVFGIRAYRTNINQGEIYDLSARVGYRHAVLNDKKQEKYAVKVSLVGKNLLNQEYSIRPALVAQPMSITGRVDFEF